MSERIPAADLRAAAEGFTRAMRALTPHGAHGPQARAAGQPIQIMEVCGTHSHAVGRFGIRQLLPEGFRLLSGPGCPVCVTPAGDIDIALELAQREYTTLCTFGDMMRVPGSPTPGSPRGDTLSLVKACGADVRVIYSPMQAVEIAQQQDPWREVVLVAVGFETTAPAVACAVLEAERLQLRNFTVLAAHKLVPPALRALLSAPDVRIDGLLCPGHVSTIIGPRAYEPLAAEFGVPCAIAGFEATDIMAGLLSLARQIAAGEARVDNVYGRSVHAEGNPKALETMYQVFAPADANWRGIGVIPDSGLGWRDEYRVFDALWRYDIKPRQGGEHPGCHCGEVLRGALDPADCPSFGKACTPDSPLGPCMVSSEGACAARWRYRDG